MKKLFLLSILLIFSCDNNQGEISDLKDTVEDLNKQISELQSSQVTSENNSTAMQNQVNELVQKIDSLEINTDVDLKQQILELLSSQVASENNSTALQNQVNGLVQKIAALEINSEKYNSEVVGCYRWGDYPFEVLKNGIGVYQTLDRILNTFTDIHIIFVWEKKNDIIEFTFPNLFLTYSSLSIENGMGHINPGTYEIPLNNLNTLSFPASANNCGTPCTRSFVKYNCPN